MKFKIQYCDWAAAAGVLAILGCLVGPAPASAKTKDAYAPNINPIFDDATPAGEPRIYTNADGSTTFWHAGLPLIKGDKAKLDVFVSTGEFELTHVKVRLDNNLFADIDQSPWSTVIDTSKLDTGPHDLEIWAQSTSPAPYSSQTKHVQFYVVASQPQGVPQSVPVKNPGTTVEVHNAPPATMSGPTTTTTGLPDLIKSGKEDDGILVQLFAPDNKEAQNSITDNKPVSLVAPVTIQVKAAPGHLGTHRFVYSLVRDGRTVFTAPSILNTGVTNVRLQGREASGGQGLLPGTVVFKVWGVDDHGNYGPPQTITLNIPETTGEGTTK